MERQNAVEQRKIWPHLRAGEYKKQVHIFYQEGLCIELARVVNDNLPFPPVEHFNPLTAQWATDKMSQPLLCGYKTFNLISQFVPYTSTAGGG